MGKFGGELALGVAAIDTSNVGSVGAKPALVAGPGQVFTFYASRGGAQVTGLKLYSVETNGYDLTVDTITSIGSTTLGAMLPHFEAPAYDELWVPTVIDSEGTVYWVLLRAWDAAGEGGVSSWNDLEDIPAHTAAGATLTEALTNLGATTFGAAAVAALLSATNAAGVRAALGLAEVATTGDFGDLVGERDVAYRFYDYDAASWESRPNARVVINAAHETWVAPPSDIDPLDIGSAPRSEIPT